MIQRIVLLCDRDYEALLAEPAGRFATVEIVAGPEGPCAICRTITARTLSIAFDDDRLNFERLIDEVSVFFTYRAKR